MVLSSIEVIYAFTPVETERIRAIPIIPMLPAKEVKKVRPFFVIRLFKERRRAVKKDMDLFFFTGLGTTSSSSSVE
jgi:hypothetical protein